MLRIPKLVACTVAVTALAVLSACGSGSTPEKDGEGSTGKEPAHAIDKALAAQLPASIKKSGVIRVATNPAYPPFESKAADGKTTVGFDPDLAKAIGDVLGVKIELVESSFDAIIPALAANKVDMAMSSIGDNKEREKVIDFATYYRGFTLLLVKKGNPKNIQADLTCGFRIGAVRGSLQQNTFLPAQAKKCADVGKPAPKVGAYENGPQAQVALQSGRLDGVLQDGPPLLEVVKKQGDIFETVGPTYKNPNPGGAAFPKGSELLKPVHAAINLLMEDGTYTKLMKKWNLSKIAIESSQINGATS